MKRESNIRDDGHAKAQILDQLRKAGTISPTGADGKECPTSFVIPEATPLTESFRKNLGEVNGTCIFCRDNHALRDEISRLSLAKKWKEIACPEKRIKDLFDKNGEFPALQSGLSGETEVVISGCEYLVASLGSVLVSSAQAGSRRMFVFPPVHIVVAHRSQLVETLDQAYSLLTGKYRDQLPSLISVITGPSRTADIEKTLILGAHGPKSLFVLVTEEEF